MAKNNNAEANAAIARWAKARDAYFSLPEEKRTQAARATIESVTLAALPVIRKANAENGKKVRRTLRAAGYRISDSGYTGLKANANAKPKRERKAKAPTVTSDTQGADMAENDANATA
jgi:hypothetical protein